MSNNTIVYIPCRAGSKRLKAKNTRILGDKPLFQHSLDFALLFKEDFFDIVVDSDDVEILEYCAKEGITYIHREKDLAGDFTSIMDVISAGLERMCYNNQEMNVVLLQPTNPFRLQEDFREFIEAFNKNPNVIHMSVDTVTKILESKNGYLEPLTYRMFERSQDTQILYKENGYYYYYPASMFQNSKILKIKPFTCNSIYNFIDIDTELDFNIATKFYEDWNSRN